MKKIVYAVFAVAVMLFGATGVSAMTQDELVEKLTATYEVNGEKFSATNAQKVEIKEYFAKNGKDLTENDLNAIYEKFQAMLKIVEDGDATSVEELTSEEKDEILALLVELGEETSGRVKVTVSEGMVKVYNVDGTPFAELPDEIVRYTDGTNYLIALASAISLVGVAAIVLKVKKANA